MNNGGKEEKNSPAHLKTEDRSPRYQSIAKLAKTTQNYLAQPGVDLRLANVSSDS